MERPPTVAGVLLQNFGLSFDPRARANMRAVGYPEKDMADLLYKQLADPDSLAELLVTQNRKYVIGWLDQYVCTFIHECGASTCHKPNWYKDLIGGRAVMYRALVNSVGHTMCVTSKYAVSGIRYRMYTIEDIKRKYPRMRTSTKSKYCSHYKECKSSEVDLGSASIGLAYYCEECLQTIYAD